MNVATRESCLVLLLAALAGCNAVLGIEEATLDPQAGAMTCELPDQRVLDRCETTEECERCLLNCQSGEIASCVANENCRKALVSYRICVGDDCTDENGQCGACLEASTAGCLVLCAGADECQGGEIVPLRDLFCACMTAKCPGQIADCMQEHAQTQDWELECLLTHCELAESPTSDHCLHAIEGPSRQCNTAPVVVPECSATKGLVGYGCDANADCCSRFCQHGVCAE